MRALVVLFAVVAVACGAPKEKRSVEHYAYAVPSAVSHQSRVDVRSSPALVAPVSVVQPVVEARALYPAATVYAGGSAVSHQSRVDIETHPAVVETAPVVEARAVYAPSYVRSSPVVTSYVAPAVYAAPSAVSHQSRVDVRSSPAVYHQEVVAGWAPAAYSTW